MPFADKTEAFVNPQNGCYYSTETGSKQKKKQSFIVHTLKAPAWRTHRYGKEG